MKRIMAWQNAYVEGVKYLADRQHKPVKKANPSGAGPKRSENR